MATTLKHRVGFVPNADEAPTHHTRQEHPGRQATGPVSWGLAPAVSPQGEESAGQGLFPLRGPLSAPGPFTILLWDVWLKRPVFGPLGLSGRRARAGRGLGLVLHGRKWSLGHLWGWEHLLVWLLPHSGAEEAAKVPSPPANPGA